jgi:hypothetical protein
VFALGTARRGPRAVGSQVARGAVAGAAAGAAGTTALDMVSYLDIAVRGRPPSRTPALSAERLAERLGVPVPGEGEQREHRLEAIGAILGAATGVAVGTAAGVTRASGVRLPLSAAALLTGLAAMAAANAGLVRLGVTDPRTWSAADWVSDILPHLAYGVVTSATLRGLLPDDR